MIRDSDISPFMTVLAEHGGMNIVTSANLMQSCRTARDAMRQNRAWTLKKKCVELLGAPFVKLIFSEQSLTHPVAPSVPLLAALLQSVERNPQAYLLRIWKWVIRDYGASIDLSLPPYRDYFHPLRVFKHDSKLWGAFLSITVAIIHNPRHLSLARFPETESLDFHRHVSNIECVALDLCEGLAPEDIPRPMRKVAHFRIFRRWGPSAPRPFPDYDVRTHKDYEIKLLEKKGAWYEKIGLLFYQEQVIQRGKRGGYYIVTDEGRVKHIREPRLEPWDSRY